MSAVDLSIARCLNCNYQLRDLPTPRCPECGQAFNPLDEATVKLPGPAAWFKRWLFARLYWPSSLFVALPMLLFCWIFSSPGPYYMDIVVVPVAGVPLLVLLLAWPKLPETASGFRRLTLIAIVLFTCGSIWFVELPLRIRFALSLPAMNHALKVAKTNRTTLPTVPGRVGLYEFGKVHPPQNNTLWRFYFPDSWEVGFGYSDTPVNYAGANAGAGGHLFGGWYWFSDD
jgi:hypothetical protein